MGYNLGPLHWELSLQQYRVNSTDHAHLQYYMGSGGWRYSKSKQASCDREFENGSPVLSSDML